MATFVVKTCDTQTNPTIVIIDDSLGILKKLPILTV